MELIKPLLSHQGLLEDIHSCPPNPACFQMWWLGQSGFLIRWNGRHLLFDPYLSDSLTRKYADTEKPHVRMTELAIEPNHLDFIDVVTSSHNHTDHLDGETLAALLTVNPELRVIVPAANQQFAAERLQISAERLSPLVVGGVWEEAGFTLHGVPAAHEDLEVDELGRHRFMGFVAEFGGFAVYHSGDTVLFDGLSEHLSKWQLDVALLPINGSRPERKVPGNLWGREAVQLARRTGVQTVVPCHYEMFTFNSVTTEEFVAEALKVGQNYEVLKCGQRFERRQLPDGSRQDSVVS